MVSKHPTSSLAFLLLLIRLLPAELRQTMPGSNPMVWSRSLLSRPARFSQTPAWAGRPFTAQIDMTGTSRHGFHRQSITFAGVGVNWNLDLDRSTTISWIEF